MALEDATLKLITGTNSEQMNTGENMGRLKINLSYLPIKAHYFLYFAGTASLWPYISVFSKQMGISERGVGYIFGIAPLAGLISKLLFGAIADQLKRKKKMFLFFILLNLMSFLCVAFLPLSKPVRPVKLDCTLGYSVFRQNDRLNSKCSDKLIESFLPEEVQMTHAHRKELPLEPEDRDLIQKSPRVKKATREASQYIEYCTAECDAMLDLTTFIQADSFCSNLISSPGSLPELCQLMLNRTNYKRVNDSTESGSEVFLRVLNDMYYRQPPTIKMDVKIKITETIGSEEDLFLTIDEVSYSKGFNDYHGLSCTTKSTLDKCFLDCPNNTVLNRHLEVILPEESLLDSMNFWLYGSLVVISWCAMAVVTSVGDALCFQALDDEPHLFGQQRQWGSVGWGMCSLMAGYLIDTSSDGKLLKDYTPCFYLLGGLLTLDLVVAYKWHIRETEKPKSIRRDVCFLLSDLRIIVFIFACVIVGMCTGLLWTFLFWYVEDLAKLSSNSTDPFSTSCDYTAHLKLLQGLIVAIQCFLGEVPFFHISGWFINKLGHTNCMTLVLAAFGVRFIIYSLLNNPWMVLPVELFQGLTFGIFYATMASYASKVSPPGIAATVQGIVGSAFEGVGVSVGNIAGGLIYSNASGEIAFRFFGVVALVFSLVHALAMFILSRKVTYGLPVDRGEQEGQEMFRISGSAQDVDSE